MSCSRSRTHNERASVSVVFELQRMAIFSIMAASMEIRSVVFQAFPGADREILELFPIIKAFVIITATSVCV